MSHYRKQVLEKIFSDAPVQSNRKDVIEVDEKRRTIYAFYCNRGEEDPDLKYERINPIQTTGISSLCEIYSFWEGDPNCRIFRERLVKNGEINEGDFVNAGPDFNDFRSRMSPANTAREGGDYSFFRTGYRFVRHFNKICEELGNDFRLVNLSKDVDFDFFKRGAVALEGKGEIKLPTIVSRNWISRVRVPLGINLDNVDPTLEEVFNFIDCAYGKLEKLDFEGSAIYLA
jgi:hypothetical protein